MKCLLLILVLQVTLSVAESQIPSTSEPHAFTISSINSGFGIQGDFEGKYSIYPDRVEVWITQADIAASKTCPLSRSEAAFGLEDWFSD